MILSKRIEFLRDFLDRYFLFYNLREWVHGCILRQMIFGAISLGNGFIL